MARRVPVAIIGLAALICNACGASPTSPTDTDTTTADSFALRGIVTGYEGAALQGATLEVLDGANKGRRAVTDAQGRYAFSGLQAGGFTIEASAVDYATSTQPVTLTANSSVDFQLRVFLAQIGVVGDSLLFVDSPNGKYSAQGEVINTGDGCAAELVGTANLLDKNLMLVATLVWSMPSNEIVRPGGRYTYQFCCLTREQATIITKFNASFRWVTVHCS